MGSGNGSNVRTMRTRFLVEGFLGVGGLFFRRLGVFVTGGGPEWGEGSAAGNASKRGSPARVVFLEGVGVGAAAEVAVGNPGFAFG